MHNPKRASRRLRRAKRLAPPRRIANACSWIGLTNWRSAYPSWKRAALLRPQVRQPLPRKTRLPRPLPRQRLLQLQPPLPRRKIPRRPRRRLGRSARSISAAWWMATIPSRSEEHTSELQSPCNLVCRLLLEKKKKINIDHTTCTEINVGHG